jgi:hypothetical protein
MVAGSGAPEGGVMVLLARIDAIAELVDRGQYLGARALLQTWRSGTDAGEVRTEILDRAEQWVDAAYAALSDGEPDPMLARDTLLQIRRALTS